MSGFEYGLSDFKDNIGKKKKSMLNVVLDRNVIEYGTWVRFGPAYENVEIYYTSLPAAGNISVNDQAVHKKRCTIDNADPNADIYIRAVIDDPEDLEYCLSHSEPDEQTVNIERIHLGK